MIKTNPKKIQERCKHESTLGNNLSNGITCLLCGKVVYILEERLDLKTSYTCRKHGESIGMTQPKAVESKLWKKKVWEFYTEHKECGVEL